MEINYFTTYWTKSLRLFLPFFLLLYTGLYTGARGQQRTIDSLRKVLQDPGIPIEKRVMTMGRLAQVLTFTDAAQALQIEKSALQAAGPFKKEGGLQAYIYANLAYTYGKMDSLLLAGQAADSAAWYADHTVDKFILGYVWFRKGWLSDIQENMDEAVKCYLKALRFLEGPGNNSNKVNIYYYLAAAYADWHDLVNQEKYARLGLENALISGTPDDLCNAYQALGSSYEYRYRADTTQRLLLDSILFCNQTAIHIGLQQKERLVAQSIISLVALNTANVYSEFYPPAYKDSALTYINIALEVGLRTGQKETIASSYGMLSDFARSDGEYDQAEKLLLRALSIIDTDHRGHSLVKVHILQNLESIAEQKGDKTKALDYYKQYIDTYKSFFDSEKLAIAKKMEAQYQWERSLQLAKQQAAFNKKLNTIYIILFLASLLALLFLFRSYHFKLRASIQQQRFLEKEKEDVQLKAELEATRVRQLELEKHETDLQVKLKAEETARLQAEQQLLAARKEHLQKELLAGKLEIEEKNGLLQDLQIKLNAISSTSADPQLKKMGRIISERQKLDEDFDSLKQDFAQIHPEFFIQLQQKASGNLTRLDIKYCTYILMGLSSKEIAARLAIEPKSIRMARYRIKQKLSLDKDASLDQFIRTLA